MSRPCSKIYSFKFYNKVNLNVYLVICKNTYIKINIYQNEGMFMYNIYCGLVWRSGGQTLAGVASS